MDKTYLILDIENGSVGSGLVRLSNKAQPKLFSEVRTALPLFDTHHSALLSREIEKAVRESLVHTGTVASRLRNVLGAGAHLREIHKAGEIERVAVFLGAPWGTPNLEKRSPDFAPEMTNFLAHELDAFAPQAPLSYYTNAGAAGQGYSLLYPGHDAIVCVVGGEIIELVLMHSGTAAGYATVPQGYRTILRTLKTHGNFSRAEAYSALKLAHEDAHYEPLEAAANNLGRELANVVQHFVAEHPVQNIFVVAQEPVGAWVARALSDDQSLAALFPQGGGVRALTAKHLSPHLMAHAAAPDHALMLEALYLGALSI